MIKIESNINQVISNLKGLERQIPFILSRTLNGMAFVTQREIRTKDLRAVFQLRNKHTERSIRVRKSTKSKLESNVYSDAYYLEEQTAGTVRTPYGDKLAIPLSKRWKNKSRRLPKKIRPDTLMRSGDAFIGKTKGGEPAIVLRTGKKRRGQRSGSKIRRTLITMHTLKKNYM